MFRFEVRVIFAALCAAGVLCAQTSYTAVDIGGVLGVGLNNSGQAVGWVYSGNNTISLFYSGALPSSRLPGMDGGSPQLVGVEAINNKGQITGGAADASGYSGTFLYSNGSMVDLGSPAGATGSIGWAINDHGEITGYADVGNYEHTFLYSKGKMMDLGTLPGGASSNGFGINNNGQIAGGCTFVATPYEHACFYSGGGLIDLGTFPAGKSSVATAINDAGQMTGWSENGIDEYAFLYSNGAMVSLGSLGGHNYASYGWGINNLGQVVGQSYEPPGVARAFLFDGATMRDLNNYVTLPNGVSLTQARSINDIGQILAYGSNSQTYLLTPSPAIGALTIVNPFAQYAVRRESPQAVDLNAIQTAPLASRLAADGQSAVVLSYRSTSPQSVTFAYTPDSGTPAGAIGPFDAHFLTAPNPAAGTVQSYQVAAPTFGPDGAGYFYFAALLWGPAAMPTPNDSAAVLQVTATQQGQTGIIEAALAIEPPPLLLIHGVWSSAKEAGFTPGAKGLYDFVAAKYPHQLIYPVDYKALNDQAFSDRDIQNILLGHMLDGLAGAASAGMAARTVDVVAHSMGGLITRYLMSTPGPLSPVLLPNPIHQLITIGTPHNGTNLAVALDHVKGNAPVGAMTAYPEIATFCLGVDCTLGTVMGRMGKHVGAATLSLEPGYSPPTPLSPANAFRLIVGDASSVVPTSTELALDALIGIYLPGQTVRTLLNEDNDTIVGISSQFPLLPNILDSAAVTNVVHTPLVLNLDKGETGSPKVWAQVYYWLTGGAGTPPASVPGEPLRPLTTAGNPPQTVFNLTGYTQVAAANVTFSPASGTTLTIGTAANITAASSTKTISEVLLSQAVTEPSDPLLLAVTQSPFSIAYTPTRLGTATFTATTVFSDQTYSTTVLTYPLQPSGSPVSLTLSNVPAADMAIGEARAIAAQAAFAAGPVDVTAAATYTVRSGSAAVFSVDAGGNITANGNGVDLLDAVYGGLTATAAITVGPCTFALSPANQVIANAAGSVQVQVTTQPGCAWTASGGNSWLTLAQAGGAGSGAIQLTASANNMAGARTALVSLAGEQAIVTQPNTACSYFLNPSQLHVPAVGASGTISAFTSCPLTVSSDQPWVTATSVGANVQYAIGPNGGSLQRSANLTIGTVPVPIVQDGPPSVCDLNGDGSTTILDVQAAVNQALGGAAATADLNQDGAVTIVDIQRVINAALGMPCVAP